MPQFFKATHPFTLSSHDEIVADIHRALQYCYGQYAHEHKIGEAGVSLVVTPRGAHGGTIHITSEVAPYEHDMMMEENTVLAHRYLPEREVREVEQKDQDEAEDYCEELVGELIAQMEEDGADREDNPSKPGIRAARAAEKAAEKEMRAAWKIASDVMYGYAHGVYSKDLLDKDIELFVAAVEAVRATRVHLHEIERGGRTGNPGKPGLPLGSVALGAALGAAAMHFGMKPKQ
jgi:hypothetical protein